MTSLSLHSITKAYGDDTVLDGISLDVANGETLVLFGPSGAGKTVLLRLIAGVVDPDAGTVEIGGEDMATFEAEDRGVGMAFQNFALFPHMSAFDNIASPLVAHRKSKAEISAAVNDVADLLKIDHVLEHHPRELSNGQKQRTALARALVGQPPLLLLDDPLRNVDAKLRFEMRIELPRLLADRGASVVYVTQDYKEAMAIGDRIAVLNAGRIIQTGTPEQIYFEPETIEIARLFGDPTINLLDVTPQSDAMGTYVEISNKQVRLGNAHDGAVGNSCVIGLRPEMIHFVGGDTSGAIPVKIEAETPLNEKTVTLAVTAGKREILISRPAGSPGPVSGTANLAIDGMKAQLFDKESGTRIRTPKEATQADGEAA